MTAARILARCKAFPQRIMNCTLIACDLKPFFMRRGGYDPPARGFTELFSMALPVHSRPWPLLQFRNNFYTDGRTPWTSDQPVARTLPKHRITQTYNKRMHTPDTHVLSGIRTHDSSVRASEDSSCFRPRGYCDRQVSQ
jgi:hypothetical protein